jgi:hypothetical protein
MLLIVINFSIFRHQSADGESEICPRLTVTEFRWDPRLQNNCIIYQKPWSLSRFLLTPG